MRSASSLLTVTVDFFSVFEEAHTTGTVIALPVLESGVRPDRRFDQPMEIL
jgi:hypothetical protein